jgi:hypothetical protein
LFDSCRLRHRQVIVGAWSQPGPFDKNGFDLLVILRAPDPEYGSLCDRLSC